jgi:hypothetical protein
MAILVARLVGLQMSHYFRTRANQSCLSPESHPARECVLGISPTLFYSSRLIRSLVELLTNRCRSPRHPISRSLCSGPQHRWLNAQVCSAQRMYTNI